MTQPIPTWEPYEGAQEVLTALGGVAAVLPVEAYRNGPVHIYVALDSEEAVSALKPDLGALARMTSGGVYCFAGSGARWRARMFHPGGGIPEDPATGSAAGPLAVHLARHGRVALGDEIEIRQGVEMGRPSTLYARATGRGESIERVEVAGSAVVVARGEFL
jgi:trans-2,3-dihydro-3-hydroxyanthranilate isomerase